MCDKSNQNKDDNWNIKKIVYFDERAATDLILIRNKGMPESLITSIKEKERTSTADAEVTGWGKLGLLFAGISGYGKLSSEFSVGQSEIISYTISGTILSEYLKIVKESQIKIISNCHVSIIPNSMAELKLITPYLIMIEGSGDVNNEFKFNIANIDKALENGKGYYELLGKDEGSDIILRFNIKAFWNKYTISDVINTDLLIHCVKIGKVAVENISFKNILKIDDKITNDPHRIMDGKKSDTFEELDVYDVIFAGV